MAGTNKVFTILCGPPGCGKSTYAKKMEELSGGRYKIISRDQVRFDMLGDVINRPEYYFSREEDVYAEFVKRIQQALNSQEYYGVFADATHLTRKSRKRLLSLLKVPDNYLIRGCYFNTSLDVCLERNEKREGWAKVPEDSLKQMFHRYIAPSRGEGFDLITEINEDGRAMP